MPYLTLEQQRRKREAEEQERRRRRQYDSTYYDSVPIQSITSTPISTDWGFSTSDDSCRNSGSSDSGSCFDSFSGGDSGGGGSSSDW